MCHGAPVGAEPDHLVGHQPGLVLRRGDRRPGLRLVEVGGADEVEETGETSGTTSSRKRSS
jgi:hypothetical protein